MNPLLLDIVNYFVANKLAQGDGIDCFRDFSPEEPDNIIVLTEYKGDEVPNYETDVVHRSVQITTRNTDADAARACALDLAKSLKSDTKFIQFNEKRWGQVTLRQPPFKIEQDENKRTIYGFNIGITTSIE